MWSWRGGGGVRQVLAERWEEERDRQPDRFFNTESYTSGKV